MELAKINGIKIQNSGTNGTLQLKNMANAGDFNGAKKVVVDGLQKECVGLFPARTKYLEMLVEDKYGNKVLQKTKLRNLLIIRESLTDSTQIAMAKLKTLTEETMKQPSFKRGVKLIKTALTKKPC